MNTQQTISSLLAKDHLSADEHAALLIAADHLYTDIRSGSAPMTDVEHVRNATERLMKDNDDHGGAHYLHGILAFNGHGMPKDLTQCVLNHQAAAKRGNADAQFELYVLYSTGQGVEKDNPSAVGWCTKAAAQGHSRACFNMGSFYATGHGVPKDIQKSVECYERASKRGHGKASATLGVMYFTGGGGIESSIPTAARYFATAEKQGFNVKKFLASLGLSMPPTL